MITKEIANAAIEVAEELDKRKIAIRPIPGTMLESLVSLATLSEVKTPAYKYTPDAEKIVSMSINTEIFNDTLKTNSDVLSRAVQNHLNFAKNVVKPAIKTIGDKVEARFNELSNIEQYTLDIRPQGLPTIMTESSFEDLVDKYRDGTYNPYNEYKITYDEDITVPDFLELIKTGTPKLDKEVLALASSLGDGYMEQLLGALFRTNYTGSSKTLHKTLTDDINAAIFAFLFANKAYDNPCKGIRLTLDSYNSKIVDLRGVCGFIINRKYENYERDIKLKRLIVSYNSKEVIVCDKVYAEWKEQGGEDSTILGSLLSSSPKVFVSDIEENKDKYQANWASNNALLLSSIKSKNFVLKKKALHSALLDEASTNFDDYFGHLRPQGSTSNDIKEYEVFKEKLDKFIDDLREKDTLNIWSLVTIAVCDTMFYYTDSRLILEGIDSAMAMNKDLDVREALLLSTIEYVVHYLVDQMKVFGFR